MFNITKKTILGLLIAGNICLCGYPADFNLPFFHKKNQVESPSNTKIQEAEESFWEQDFEDIDDNVPEINKDTNFIKSGTVMADETLAEQNSKEIRSVQIVGTNVISPESILPKLKTKAGEKFDKNVMQDDLKTIYAMGDFTARMKAVPTDNPDGTIDIEIVVEENIPVTDFQIYGNEVVSKEEILSVFYPLIGKPQNINKFNEAIEQINACYASKGYILAKINSIYDDPDGTINIEFDEGIIGKILISGNDKTKDYIVARNIMTEPGMVYNENQIKQDLVRLYSTQAFKDVNREITPSEDELGRYDVTIVVSEQRTAAMSLGGGLDSATGVFGSLSISDNNFRGLNQRVGLSGMAGTGVMMSDSSIIHRMNFQAELSFFEPHFINADNSLMSKLYFRDFGSYQVPLAIETRFGIEGTVAHRLKHNKNMAATFTLSAENINLREGDAAEIASLYSKFMPPSQYASVREKQLSDGVFITFAPGLTYDTRDSVTNPRKGTLANLKFEESLCVSDLKKTTGRLSGMVKRYVPVASKSSMSFMARAGGRIHGDEMPEFLAYRLGGPYTIRGYRVNGVGVGDSFVMGSVELVTPLLFLDRIKKVKFFDNLRLAFFVDAGKIFNPTITDLIYDRPMQAITAGVGLKLFIPGVGPLSVDYGIPLTNPGENGNKSGYFTFGVGDSMMMY